MDDSLFMLDVYLIVAVFGSSYYYCYYLLFLFGLCMNIYIYANDICFRNMFDGCRMICVVSKRLAPCHDMYVRLCHQCARYIVPVPPVPASSAGAPQSFQNASLAHFSVVVIVLWEIFPVCQAEMLTPRLLVLA